MPDPVTLTEYREDVGGSITSRIDDNGYLRVEGVAAKTGVLTYLQQDGTIRRELVTPECLFDKESIDTMIGAPVTVGHPALLTSETASIYSRGSVPKARADGSELKISMVVTGSDAIAHIDRGVRQLSPGYKAIVRAESGEYEGQRYDAVQVKRLYNHLAIVPSGRGGTECRINLDGLNYAVEQTPTTTREVNKMPTVKLTSGATVEVADASTATALQSDLNALAQRADAADKMVDQAKYDELQGKYDALVAEMEKMKEKPAERMDADEIGAYIETVEKAKQLKSDVDIKLDGAYLDATGVMAAALGIDAKDKSPEYIAGRFDSALELMSSDSVRKQRETKFDAKDRVLTGREKFMAEQQKRGA